MDPLAHKNNKKKTRLGFLFFTENHQFSKSIYVQSDLVEIGL